MLEWVDNDVSTLRGLAKLKSLSIFLLIRYSSLGKTGLIGFKGLYIRIFNIIIFTNITVAKYFSLRERVPAGCH